MKESMRTCYELGEDKARFNEEVSKEQASLAFDKLERVIKTLEGDKAILLEEEENKKISEEKKVKR